MPGFSVGNVLFYYINGGELVQQQAREKTYSGSKQTEESANIATSATLFIEFQSEQR